MTFVRFQSLMPNPDGRFVGVFGLVNGLAKAGLLTTDQEVFRQEANAWYDANFANPSHVDPTVYDPERNPGAVAWFKATAHDLIARVDGYLAILDEHGVGCVRVTSADPGVVVYEDPHQVVVVNRPQAPEPS